VGVSLGRLFRRHVIMTLLAILFCLLALGIVLHELYLRASWSLMDEHRGRALSIASTGALLFSADDLDALTQPVQADSFEHRRVVSVLRRVRDASPGIRRVFLLRRLDDPRTARLLADADVPQDSPPQPAASDAGPVSDLRLSPQLAAGFDHPSAEQEFSESPAGFVLAAYAPISGPSGMAPVALGIWLDAGDLHSDQRRLLASATLVFMIVTLLAATAGLFYLRKEMIYRTNLDLLRESRHDLTRMVQAEKELTRKNRELQVLSAVSEQMSTSFELSRNLHLALERLLDLAGIDGAIVRLMDHETQELYLAAHRGLSPLLFEGYKRIPVGHSFSGSVAASGESLFVENIPPSFGSADAEPFDRRIRSYGVVPIRARREVLGTMTLFSLSDPRFPSPYKDLVFSIARQIAIAVENATLYERERSRAAQLLLVADISKQALAMMDIDGLLQLSIDRIQREFHFFFIAYYGVDAGREVFERKAQSGGFFEMGIGNLDDEVPMSEGMLSVAYREKRTAYVPDTAAEEQFSGLPGNLAKSDLVVPVLIDGQVVGLFEVQSTMVKGFSGEDVLMVETVADQIAIALKNIHKGGARQVSSDAMAGVAGRDAPAGIAADH